MATNMIYDKAYSQRNFYGSSFKSSDTFDETCLESSQDDNPELIYSWGKEKEVQFI